MTDREILDKLIEEVQAFVTDLNKNFDPVPYYAATEADVGDLRYALRQAQDQLEEKDLTEKSE